MCFSAEADFVSGVVVGGVGVATLREAKGRSELPLALLPLAAASSVPVMALLVLPAGMFIAPLLATRNELIGWVAPPGARTEAYTWPVTAFVGGIAIGSAMAGGIVEASSWRLAFLVAAGAAAVGAVVAVARRGTLNPQVGV